ncbi:AraC family transcriptional regulator [Parvibaculum sp.]|uniref:AraC family transcriptional regulator n=1 Tax=Parvibaculum sp. TaxID=2024848 RepID=UPI000C8EB090|nr:AraC family transcriptional regulator [Parvibaculum sp.]MAB14323.1 hypothetical protein [Parvibaculum sp.]
MANFGYINLDDIDYGTIHRNVPWGIHVEPRRMLALFVVSRGKAWFQTDNKSLPRVELGEGDIIGVSAGIGYTLSSEPEPAAASIIDGREIFESLARKTRHTPSTGEGDTELVIGRVPLKKQVLAGIYPTISLLTPRDGKPHLRTRNIIDMIIRDYAQADGSPERAILKRLTEALAIELLTNVERKRARGEDRFWHPTTTDRSISSALDLLHQNPQEDWTLERLAQAVGLSRSVFAERFRNITGGTPISYLTSIRINRAIILIEEGALSLSEIAFATGYMSEAAFSRAFVREKGITPGRFRSSILKDAAQ